MPVDRKLFVPPRPCVSCPYRLDCPSGVWSEEEYEKLRVYDDPYAPEVAVFHCHQENATGVDTVCRGWLTVASESVAVRVAGATGRVTGEEVYAEPPVPLHPSGNAAADFGERDIECPSRAAIAMASKLLDSGAALDLDG